MNSVTDMVLPAPVSFQSHSSVQKPTVSEVDWTTPAPAVGRMVCASASVSRPQTFAGFAAGMAERLPPPPPPPPHPESTSATAIPIPAARIPLSSRDRERWSTGWTLRAPELARRWGAQVRIVVAGGGDVAGGDGGGAEARGDGVARAVERVGGAGRGRKEPHLRGRGGDQVLSGDAGEAGGAGRLALEQARGLAVDRLAVVGRLLERHAPGDDREVGALQLELHRARADAGPPQAVGDPQRLGVDA